LRNKLHGIPEQVRQLVPIRLGAHYCDLHARQ
jgi:hypothetical protein